MRWAAACSRRTRRRPPRIGRATTSCRIRECVRDCRRQGSVPGPQRQAAVVEVGTIVGVALGVSTCGANTLGFSLSERSRTPSPPPDARSRESHVPIGLRSGRQAHLRQAIVGVLSNTNHEEDHRSIQGRRHSLQKTRNTMSMLVVESYCPAASMNGSRRRPGHASSSRPAMRPLQNLRREGSKRQHHRVPPEGGGDPIMSDVTTIA